MPATEKKTKAPKTNYRAECGSLAAEIPGLVLVPGMTPDGIRGYVKQEDGSLTEWGPSWTTWRDVFHDLSGYTRHAFDTDPDFEVKD